ncbi:tRNA (guanosine(37)-N1)-methyltransferase TrmD [Sporosalibacterium faouarense]|uniref:tRNA (guanosine(37)-N1)-methyltransferase TrmD n=1 Tax=Sporosalibacterium faouarense TaxID=516123 RepID=UPI00192B824B|nr:tRNA (guanosine(37)-N1)-methyltransferase TrmD [Sporosalibacterium faouarense]
MKINVLTLFPEMFNSLNHSIIGRAIDSGLISINYTNIRDFSQDKHNRVDDYPFGGGPGMVMKPGPVFRSIESVKQDNSRVIYLSPKGKVFNQEIANELSKEDHIVLLCGHYEGIDNRVIEEYVTDEISIGDYVLTGGEIASMVIIDSVARLIPGVLGKDESFMDESHYDGLLEYPQYTRPREFNELKVPDILLSGNHQKIDEWRKYQSIKSTLINRPDMIEKKDFNEEEKRILDIIKNEIRK